MNLSVEDKQIIDCVWDSIRRGGTNIRLRMVMSKNDEWFPITTAAQQMIEHVRELVPDDKARQSRLLWNIAWRSTEEKDASLTISELKTYKMPDGSVFYGKTLFMKLFNPDYVIIGMNNRWRQYPQYMSAFLIFVFLWFVSFSALAIDGAPLTLQTCLKKANDLPDIAVAEAEVWLKNGGGEAAVVCRATAEFNSGAFAKAAEDFSTLAANEPDTGKAAVLYQQAGLSYMRMSNFKKSDEQYDKAVKYEAMDPDLWVARGNERAASQRYWEAIEDFNRALGIMPDMPEALRSRGQVWVKLNLPRNAEEDFRHAAEVQAEEDSLKHKAQPVAVKKKP